VSFTLAEARFPLPPLEELFPEGLLPEGLFPEELFPEELRLPLLPPSLHAAVASATAARSAHSATNGVRGRREERMVAVTLPGQERELTAPSI
jgi:hypothetical protein